MSRPDEIRKSVSEAYAKAVSTAKSCCGPTPCCGDPTKPDSVIAQAAGYSPAELDTVPSDAVASSFGCGNPVALGNLREGDTVVDLGSGAGIDIILAGKKVGPTGKVIGIDMTGDMIARARANAAAAGLENVEVREGLIEQLPVESSSVDWVISNCVINLSPEKERVFAEIARVLGPGGQMLVSDIVVEDLPEWVRGSRDLYSACVAGAISEREYLEGLRRAGLEQVEVRDRLVYEAAQIEAFVQSGELGDGEGFRGAPGEAPAKQIGEALAGKVWSAKFYARKPATI